MFPSGLYEQCQMFFNSLADIRIRFLPSYSPSLVYPHYGYQPRVMTDKFFFDGWIDPMTLSRNDASNNIGMASLSTTTNVIQLHDSRSR